VLCRFSIQNWIETNALHFECRHKIILKQYSGRKKCYFLSKNNIVMWKTHKSKHDLGVVIQIFMFQNIKKLCFGWFQLKKKQIFGKKRETIVSDRVGSRVRCQDLKLLNLLKFNFNHDLESLFLLNYFRIFSRKNESNVISQILI
jgi:hypothetical protein